MTKIGTLVLSDQTILFVIEQKLLQLMQVGSGRARIQVLSHDRGLSGSVIRFLDCHRCMSIVFEQLRTLFLNAATLVDHREYNVTIILKKKLIKDDKSILNLLDIIDCFHDVYFAMKLFCLPVE